MKIEYTPVSEVGSTISESGYMTYSTNYPVDLSTISGGTAYVASSVTNGMVVLTKCTDKVPVGTGLIIAGTAGADFTIQTYSDAATFSGTNLLVGLPNGGTVAAATEGYNYVFGWTDPTNPGFYKVTTDEAALGNFKAYLHTTDALGNATARLGLTIDGDETTAVQYVETTSQHSSNVFDLQGRRISQPAKGLYIMNGKKYMVK